MLFTVGFLNNGVPDDTLSPVVNIWEAGLNGTQVATNESMDRISAGAGGYVYDLTTADPTKSYYGEAYASGLPAGQQYAPCITTVQGEVSDILADTIVIQGQNAGIQATADEIEIDTGTTIPDQLDLIEAETDKIQTIDNNVDAILIDTDQTIPNQLDLIETETDKIQTIDNNVDAILVDTDQTIPNQLDLIEADVDLILVDTDQTIPNQLDLIETETDKIQTIDDNVDAILVDTATTIPDQLDLIQTETDKIDTVLANIALAQVDIDFIKAIEGGAWSVINNQMIFYEDDNVTEVARFNLFAGGTPAITNVDQRLKV
jgi:hypothetical protein